MYNKKEYVLVTYWLSISLILVLFMISIGGLTRLTGSGLSITEWEVFKGIFPPVTQNRWDEYFLLYKQIPQFKLINPDMSLQEFKVIFYWEYFHRLLGRLIGLFFLIPLVYFTFKKILKKNDLIIFYFIFFLICLQGLIGWYMVQSGLINNVTVSHYRLSLHLLMAFIIIGLIFWSLLSFLYSKTNNNQVEKNKTFFNLLISLIFLQIFFGALVSGLDAGRIYQTWPLMNESYYPDDIKIQNLFELDNQSSVQFIHRNLAYFLFIYTLFLGSLIYYKHKYLINCYLIVFIFVLTQMFLGIITLLSGINNYIALLHQLTGVALFLSSIYLRFKLTL